MNSISLTDLLLLLTFILTLVKFIIDYFTHGSGSSGKGRQRNNRKP